MNIAIVGGTGLAGLELLRLIHKRGFKYDQLELFASERSAGKVISCGETAFTVESFRESMFDIADVAFFAVDATLSRRYAPIAKDKGALVIDKSSAYRMDPDVPLVIPEINGETALRHKGVIASPNCSTTILCMALWPLHKAAGLKRVVVDTYQSISGGGVSTLERFEHESAAHPASPDRLYDNVVPQIDAFGNDGYTGEETKMIEETQRILSLPELRIVPTCVRVPVLRGHSMSVNAEFEKPITPAIAKLALESAPGVKCLDNPLAQVYPTPAHCVDREECLVGRIRAQAFRPNALSFFVAGDNLWKGAALNALQIAESLI